MDKIFDKRLKDILFFTYLTNFNIGQIYYAIENNCINNVEDFITTIMNKSIDPFLKPNLKSISVQIKNAEEESIISIEKLRYYNIKPIPYFSNDYPNSLNILKDKPPIIYIKGNLDTRKLATVIGTRDTSTNAERVTNKIVDLLIDKNYGIVSGLAIGIDTLAHKRAVQKDFYNIAVLPNSLDTIYPKENYGLACDIIDRGGALVSELIFGINRGKLSFVERNRIQAGLAKIVIPIEMGIKSGTMHTINFSKAQKKDIFLIKPSPISSNLTQYQGILYLIESQLNDPKSNVHIIQTPAEFNASLEDIEVNYGTNTPKLIESDKLGEKKKTRKRKLKGLDKQGHLFNNID